MCKHTDVVYVCMFVYLVRITISFLKEQTETDTEMVKEEKARRKMMEEVAKHIRFKVSNRQAVIKGQKIEFFNGSYI